VQISRSAVVAATAALVTISGWSNPVPQVTRMMGSAALAGSANAPALPKPLSVPTMPIVHGQSVGYLPANWTVNDSGAFVYTIPLDVPDGHLTPALALTYSSANRSNGELGVGWTLQGPSAITRCGANLTVDGAVSVAGRFCLDGQKLIAVPDAPGLPISSYGGDGTHYRTESDMYARITSIGSQAGGPENFLIELRSGVTREYRAVKVPLQNGSLSSVIAPPSGSPGEAPLADAVANYVAGDPVADRWVLSQETDRSGNGLHYVWSDQDADAIDPVTHGIEVRLKEIVYTRQGDSNAFRKVTIEPEDRVDNVDFTWHLGVRSELRHRIKSITAYAPSPRVMAPVWTYLVGYAPTLSRSGRALLTSVQRCGMGAPANAGSGQSANGVGGCLWKKEFSWGDDKAGSTEMPTFTSHTVKEFDDPVTWPAYDDSNPANWANLILAEQHPPVMHVLDLDGDGTDDVVLQVSVGQDGLPTHIFRGQHQSNGMALALSQYSFFDGAMQPNGRHDNVLLQTARAVDLDNSGRDQLLTVRQLQNLDPYGNPDQGWTYEEKLFGWGPNGFGPSDEAPLFGIYDLDPKRFNFVDLDGDRRMDAVVESDGANSGTGSAFFWWNKTWDVWMNQGGTLVKTGSVPLETKCPSQITDADGDGRGELVQLYDHDEVIGKMDGGLPWATEDYDANSGFLGHKQYECTAIGYLMATAAGQPVVWKGSTLVAPSSKQAAARANKPVFGRHEVPEFTYGDFNGDGLEDEFSAQYDGAGQVLHAWVRWNMGTGYGPRQEVPDFFPDMDISGQTRTMVADLDGDGKDDLISLRQPGANGQPALVVALSDGHGGFAKSNIPGGPGLFDALETYTTTRIGDFNGDGRPDLVNFTDPKTLVVRLQDPQYNERLMTVAEEPTPWDSLTVVYDTQWSDKPEATQPCAYPLACLRHGSTVVRRVLSREHLVSPTAAELSVANARTTYYSYEDPVINLRGRGHLGFRKVRQWDPWRPIEVVREYDNRTEVGRGYYPGIASPVRVTTVVPFALVGSNGSENPPDTSGHSTPASMMAHVTRTQTVAAVQALNKEQSGDAWGLTYDVHPTDWLVTEWEQPVLIDWSTETSEHLSSADPAMELYSDQKPASVLRMMSGSATYDDFGNLIHGESQVVGAQTVQVDNQFKNLTQSTWQIGQLYFQKMLRSDGNDKVTRTAEFYYDGQGRLTDAYREKGNADPSIPAATHVEYDKTGNVVSVQVTARNDANIQETRDTRFEYAPAVSGWADEKLYPSQIWSTGVVAYQPSTWMAIYPAYGVPVAVMDANGVQTRTQYDDLGRPVSTERDGSLPGTLYYAGRADSGGFNGLVVTATAGQQTADMQTDALGRSLQSGDRAFDGTMRYVQKRYDTLGRLKSISRPFAAGNLPSQYTTFVYDALDRVVKTTAPDSSYSHYAYPTFFETHTFDANNSENVIVRDLLDRPISSANMLNGKAITTAYTYSLGGVENVSTPSGVTHTEYNLLGLPSLQDTPDTGRTNLFYTGFGQIWQSLHQKTGDTIMHHYDALGRLIHNTSSTDGDTLFVYDTAGHGLGRLAEAESPDKVQSRFGYDQTSGRVISMEQELDGITDRVNLNFDTITGHLLGMDYPSVDGSLTPGLSVLYGYNNADYVDTVSTRKPGQNPQPIWHVMARNLDGALLSGVQGWAGQMEVQRHYATQTGRLDAMTVLQGNTPLLHLGYGYFPNGLVQSREDQVVQRQEHFAYDALLRLTHADLTYNGTVHNTEYGYDPSGNLLTVDGEQHLIGQAIGPLESLELNAYGSSDPTFPQPHTLTGHTENGITQAYVYDSHGRRAGGGGLDITAFTAFDLPKTVVKGSQKWNYLYDAFGSKVKETSPDGAAVTYVAGIYERHTTPGKDTRQVFHIPGTDGSVADIVYNAAPPKTYTPSYLLEDGLGSTSAVVDNVGGVERRHYEPFGKRINPDGSAYAGPLSLITSGFTGHEHEDALGLINMRGRLYDPTLKRFLTPDPYVTHPGFGQSWNPYTYVLNSPLNFTDPSGFRDCQDMHENPDGGSGIVCGDVGQNGNLAPGTGDFDACKSCNGDGSARHNYGGDLNGQSTGPGFFNHGPKDNDNSSSDGHSNSGIAQSGSSGYTSTGRRGAIGNIDLFAGNRVCGAAGHCFDNWPPRTLTAAVAFYASSLNTAFGFKNKTKVFNIVMNTAKQLGVEVVMSKKEDSEFFAEYKDGKAVFYARNPYMITGSDGALTLVHELAHGILDKKGLILLHGTALANVKYALLDEIVAFSVQWLATAELVNKGLIKTNSDLSDQERQFFSYVRLLDLPGLTTAGANAILEGAVQLAIKDIAERGYFDRYKDYLETEAAKSTKH
jgi:RHS repeat-associated protein